MKNYMLRGTVVILAALAAYIGTAHFLLAPPEVDVVSAYTHVAKASKLESAYAKWVEQHEQRGGDRNVVFGLGWSKAYSKSFTQAHGEAHLDLIDGTVTVRVDGLETTAHWDVWLIDNQPGPGHSAAPDPGDYTLRVGTLEHGDKQATLRAALGKAFDTFEVDLVTITRAGKTPSEAGILFGSQDVFQRLYTRARTGRLTAPEHTSHLTMFGPQPAYAAFVFPTFDQMVIDGADTFLNETFGGNGRTCGSCHQPLNNFTIDPQFIATLPCTDPLFVAEHAANPGDCPGATPQDSSLAGLENPALMRRLGLILENTNGFENPPTMRSTPHTLALSTSIDPQPKFPLPKNTGWSGDGSPDGTLHGFANGAIRQHLTKRIARVPGTDFRFATQAELDNMEVFQLSLGRDADPDISAISFTSSIVSFGRDTFNSPVTGKCLFCHFNAGATVSFEPGANFNFDTGVEALANQPADLIDPDPVSNPPVDDGLQFPGNGTFSTPPVIEAADTGPFFHNHSIETIEGAVAFYNSDAFNTSLSGSFTGGIDLETTEVVAVAAFLRTINVLENIRSAHEVLRFTLENPSYRHSAKPLYDLAKADIEDAIQVLRTGGLHPGAQQRLQRAYEALHGKGKAKIESALDHMRAARAHLCVPGSEPTVCPDN